MPTRSRILYLLVPITSCLFIALGAVFVLKRVLNSRQQPEQTAPDSVVAPPQPVEVQPVVSLPVAPVEKKRLRRVLVPLSAGGMVLLVGAMLFIVSPVLSAFFTTHVSTAVKTVAAAGLTRPAIPVSAPIRSVPFEAGIVTPQWERNAYGTAWQQALPVIRTQAGARWIELSILFSQDTSSSTNVTTTQSTPSTDALAIGIRAAHAQGFKVFLVPLLTVQQPGGWAGSIQFSNQQQEQAWFDSYWNVFQPYVQVAAQQGADQMAIATECAWLQQHAPTALWNQLIARIHAVFMGKLTYDMNWWPTDQPVPTWFSNQQISYIGVSAYIPLSDTAVRIAPAAMTALWHSKIIPLLDAIYDHSGKPVLVSEIGYRNSADALYHTWEQNSTLPTDQEEQAGAYNAALSNVIADPRLVGIFFWGWDNVGRFTLKDNTTTLATLHQWYTSPSVLGGA